MTKPVSDKPALESLTRKRGVVIGVALLAMALAAAGAWLTISFVSREAAQVNLLPIRSVSFVGDLKRVDQDELKRIAGGIQTIGGSMLRTDLNQVKAVVRQVEWVRDAEVRRRFPGTLEIQIEEHKPFARWQFSNGDVDAEQSLLVNTFGEVFAADTEDPLPLLSGPADSAVEVMTQWLAFGRQLDALGTASAELRPAELRLSPRRAWQLKLVNGSTLELGRNDAAARLARFVRAVPQVPALQLASARVDLRYQSGLAVRGVLAKPAARPAEKKPATNNKRK